MAIKPKSKPNYKKSSILSLLKEHGIEDQVALVGVRSYYRNTMGKPAKNDRGIYDDAIFLVSPTAFLGCNANTDPSIYRKGHGPGSAKGVAMLKEGIWRFTTGYHRGQYRALRQSGFFTLYRDADESVPESKVKYYDTVRVYEDTTDSSGINIHKGGFSTTSSLGCQTIHPDQWEEFIALVYNHLKLYKQKSIPYLLIENDGSL